MTPSAPRRGELVSLTEAASRLGVHYMTAYRYVRTGRLEGVKHGAEWRVRAEDIDRLRAGTASHQSTTPARRGTPRPARSPSRSRRHVDWAGRVEERLLAGDEAGAWTVVDSAMAGGMEPADLYLGVLGPAMRSIGERWARDEITVADEHRASAIAQRLIGRLGPRFARRGRKRGTVLLAGPAGEGHALPMALVADLLRGRGFDVVDLGADVPHDALAALAGDLDDLTAVGLCATTSGNDASITAALGAVRAVTDAPVLLGGGAIPDPAAALAHGADGGGWSTPDLLDAVDHLDRHPA